MKTKSQFYAVRWGDNPNGNGPDMADATKCRISGDPVPDAVAACRDCFGMVSAEMWTKPLGSSRSALKVTKMRLTLLNDPNGWTRISSEKR